jgi:thymidine kinase
MLHVIAGPVKSGKTKLLIDRAGYFEGLVLAYVAKSDKSASTLSAYNSNLHIPCKQISSPLEILSDIPKKSDKEVMIAIDDVHVMPSILFDVVMELNYTRHCSIVVAGTSHDWLNRPISIIASLLSMADKVTKVSSGCVNCDALDGYRCVEVDDEKGLRLEPVCNRCYTYLMRTNGIDFFGDRPMQKTAARMTTEQPKHNPEPKKKTPAKKKAPAKRSRKKKAAAKKSS